MAEAKPSAKELKRRYACFTFSLPKSKKSIINPAPKKNQGFFFDTPPTSD